MSENDRRKYQEKLKAKLKEWQDKINLMKIKLNNLSTDAKLSYQQQLENLEKNKQLLESKLEELKNSSEDSWQELKSGLKKAEDDFSEALKKAILAFK